MDLFEMSCNKTFFVRGGNPNDLNNTSALIN